MNFNKYQLGVLQDAATDSQGGGGVTIDVVNQAINGAMAKLKTEVMTSVTGAMKPFEGLNDTLKTITDNLATLQTATPPPPDDKKKKDGELPPEVNAQLKALNDTVRKQGDQLTAEKTARETAEKAARDGAKASALRAELDQFDFSSPEAKDDAFTLASGLVNYDDTGNLVAEGLPMKDFVKDFVTTKKRHLLAPENRGGTGANKGTHKPGQGAFQLENIKPGMSLDDQMAAAAAIRAVLPNQPAR